MTAVNRALRSDSERTRRRILEAARDLCRTEGYEHIRMVDVADRVSCSRATIYNHFPTRDDLLEALCLSYLGGFLNLFDSIFEWLEPRHTVFEVLRETMAVELRWRSTHDVLRGALDSARRLRAPFYVQAEQRIDDAMLAWYSDIYSASARHGLLNDDVDPVWASAPIYAMTDSVLAQFPVGSADDVPRTADRVARLQWRALYRDDPADAPTFASIGMDSTWKSPESTLDMASRVE